MPRAPNGSSTKAAMPMSVSFSACPTCDAATPRLPGTTITSGSGPLPDVLRGRNSLPSIVTACISAGGLMAW
jgi:hypothetical protein